MYQLVTDQFGRTRGLINANNAYDIPRGWSLTLLHEVRENDSYLMSLPVLNA